MIHQDILKTTVCMFKNFSFMLNSNTVHKAISLILNSDELYNLWIVVL